MVVACNLFGDILSNLSPACTGTIGIAPSANLDPECKFSSLFEPVHGSAPNSARRALLPIRLVRSGGRHDAGISWHKDAHDGILAAIQNVLKPQNGTLRTPDLGG